MCVCCRLCVEKEVGVPQEVVPLLEMHWTTAANETLHDALQPLTAVSQSTLRLLTS